MSEKNKFSYSRFVRDGEDVVGLIAYSLYTSKKLEFAKGYVRENKKMPDKEQIANFHLRTALNVESCRQEAHKFLSAHVATILDEVIKEVEEKSQGVVEEEVIEKITKYNQGSSPYEPLKTLLSSVVLAGVQFGSERIFALLREMIPQVMQEEMHVEPSDIDNELEALLAEL